MPIPGPRPCPICRSTEVRAIAKHARDHLVRCSRCSLVFTGIEPTPEELTEYYRSYPAHGDLSPVTMKRFNELLDHFEQYRKTGRMIDVGCGAGHFLQLAAGRGWTVFGTEFGVNTVAACRAKGIDIIEGPLDPNNYEAGSFDVVCSFEVVEHLTHPVQEWERMASLLRPGGLLYATTPNYGCVSHFMTKGEWSVVSYPEHLNYFTPRTLKALAKSQGLRKKWLVTTGVTPQRLFSSRSSTKAERQHVSESQEHLRTRIEGNRGLQWVKSSINGALNFFKVGDSMKGGFEKTGSPS